jgi:hypothetical protein
VLTWLGLLVVAVWTWDDFVVATGDTLDECDRGECGTLGEFTDEHPWLLFLLLAGGAAIPAALVARLVRRRSRTARQP